MKDYVNIQLLFQGSAKMRNFHSLKRKNSEKVVVQGWIRKGHQVELNEWVEDLIKLRATSKVRAANLP